MFTNSFISLLVQTQYDMFPAMSPLPPTHSTSAQAATQFDHRLVAAKLPEYRKVDDTRHPSRQQTAAPQDNPSSDSSDVDSLPDVHWFKAFFCYYSCWSHGRLRMPPRWRLERVEPR
ncbi:hypothetical protein DEU56DRAFT_760402 [Suillus clintonianus]|uniref:uncharacterized protein n=1 Tax=Suillus clintonianus TaxID=1904413 RepID=UPI001B87D6D5|nr:uncharacterized protein DEU56DRAFT_760402 [Suillus clintonianus]KAG2122220.1 hypothetical protein DEU56DRAFT_760402 [Suillus clintonianus]